MYWYKYIISIPCHAQKKNRENVSNMLLFSKIIMMKSHFLLRSFSVQSEFPFVQLSLQSNTFSPSTVTSSDFFFPVKSSSTSSSFFESVVHYRHYYIMRTAEISKRYILQYIHTEGCIKVYTIETLLSDYEYELYSSYVHKRLLKFDQSKT